jgi:hypothetical protein
MGTDAAAGYWNHNTTYHAWLVDPAAKHRDDVVDAAVLPLPASVVRRVSLDPCLIWY